MKKKTVSYWYMHDFSVDYKTFDISDFINVHKYFELLIKLLSY